MTTSSSSTRMGRAGRRVMPLVLAGLASLVLAASPAMASNPTPLGSNLLSNPGAQSGHASPDGQTPVTIPGWDDTFANMTVVKYGTSGFPGTHESNRFGGGTKFFSTGPYDNGLGTCGDADQTIVLTGRGNAIDNGQVRARLSGRVAAGGPAVAHLDLYFRTSNNHSVAVNGITKHASSTSGSFVLLGGSKVLPKHTRTLRIHIWASGVSSGYCKAYFDKLSVIIEHV
jgi:hypothetical protein